ncbi:hypothetical protein ACSNOI_40600, partial [Actinomadura kijaniata]|uniref:hypothetical protein n=1 Tax=Actinomadura kijaniata TaxID=46161 RepID=UPI003F1D2039
MSEYPHSPPRSGVPGERPADASAGETARREAAATADQAGQAARQVTETAVDQARTVAAEGRDQARQVVQDVRGRVGEEMATQTRRASQVLRQWSDDLADMASGAKPDSPARQVVHQIADGGRQAADYLDDRGVGGAVEELQNFARRRPGLFLAGAALAGFAVGRMAKAARAQATGGSRTGDAGDAEGYPAAGAERWEAPAAPMPPRGNP